jgi:hypothetical protein
MADNDQSGGRLKVALRQSLPALVICGLLVLSGLGVVVWAAYRMVRIHQTGHWSTAEGEVLESTLKRWAEEDGPMYEAVIRYRYSANDQTYDGSTISAGYRATGRHDENAALVAAFPVGTKIPVHYDPADPTKAVLVDGGYGLPLGDLLFGAVFAMISAGFLSVVLWLTLRHDKARAGASS